MTEIKQGTRNRGQNVSLSTSTIPSYGEFEPGPRQASSPLTPDSPKQFLNHVDRGVYVIKDLSEDPGPFVDRLPYRTPTRPKEIRLSPCDNNILTTSPDNGRLTTPVQEQGQPESPHVFLSPVDKGIFVINSTFDSSQTSLSNNNNDANNDKKKNHAEKDKNSKRYITNENEATSAERKPPDRRQIYGVDENKERGNWTGRLDFLLSMLGYCVGLGNIWRFPYLCYRNGGGAFLLPFIIMMLLVGIPLFYLEAALGQFCSRGPTTCWEFAPLFKGLGIAMLIMSGLTSIYYNVLITWSVLYFFSSFTSDLPWSNCDNKWNTKDCTLKLPKVTCFGTEQKFANGTCYSNHVFKGIWNDAIFKNVTGRRRVSPTEEYWNNKFLSISSGIDDLGEPKYELALGLLFAWILCFLCLLKGIKTTGKVVYVTAIFPYIVLFILFFRGITLEGAGQGIYYYIVPNFERLLDAKVWRDAAVQIFYSMGPGWGGLIALASYNRFHNNVFRDSLVVSLGDCVTSIFGGFVIFSFLGHMASQMNVEVKDVVTNGAGLAFVVYPEAIQSLPLPTLWSILFFLMLITLGIDSQFAMLESVLTGIVDYFPGLRSKKTLVMLVISIVFYILGLPMTTPGGMYILQLMDHYVASWSLLIVGLTEVLVISYVYGINRYLKDLEIMLGRPPFLCWKICWMFVSPIIICIILLFAWIDYSPIQYGSYSYPEWAEALGWLMSFFSIIFIPIVMLYKINKEDEGKNAWEKVKLLCTPSREWGPALVRHRELVDYVDGFVADPWVESGSHQYVNYGYDASMGSHTTTDVSRQSWASGYTQNSHVSYESAV
ncbi:sodium- and chloride-dependent glycine transporter 1-like isoform X1 [Crassostrea angulata]|uniref:sodium- and chloride-dependent glycine transporter 1-like isoform X1 n=1 Tax=Magallana angulata TaxID=2784310 RepID=UPI0022B1C0E3|nr:sodium- and chloride-dependent glycine transporter 1-like isoform X1 [Crassostrea angulata]